MPIVGSGENKVPVVAGVLPRDADGESGGSSSPNPASLSERRQGQNMDRISDGYCLVSRIYALKIM